MMNVVVTINDPAGRLSALPLLVPTIQAAVRYLDAFVVFRGTVDVAVNVETTSTGRFGGNGDIVYAGLRQGLRTWEASLVAESRTGVDPDPGKADLEISIDPTSSYIAQLWWDPGIGTSLAANPPNDRTDAFSVVLHELLHGMGVIGWRDIQTGALPGDYQSVWDSLVTVQGGRASFSGPATLALMGSPVEVRLGGSQGAFHLGQGPDVVASAQPWLERSQLNGYYFFLGERYTLGRLELALLQDLGWSLDPGVDITDVVNRWDDKPASLYLVGWETDEVLVGGSLDDRIEGRGGRDRLQGGPGNDTLDGGAGLDAAVYDGARNAYRVAHEGGGALIVTDTAAGNGSDALAKVERLVFADQSLAFDLEGHAGVVARYLGAVFGPAAVSNRVYAGIGLGLVDTGTAPGALMQLALEARLGAGFSAASLVELLYLNLTGAAAPPADLAYWVGELANGRHTPVSLATMAAELELNESNIGLVGLVESGLAYLPGPP